MRRKCWIARSVRGAQGRRLAGSREPPRGARDCLSIWARRAGLRSIPAGQPWICTRLWLCSFGQSYFLTQRGAFSQHPSSLSRYRRASTELNFPILHFKWLLENLHGRFQSSWFAREQLWGMWIPPSVIPQTEYWKLQTRISSINWQWKWNRLNQF